MGNIPKLGQFPKRHTTLIYLPKKDNSAHTVGRGYGYTDSGSYESSNSELFPLQKRTVKTVKSNSGEGYADSRSYESSSSEIFPLQKPTVKTVKSNSENTRRSYLHPTFIIFLTCVALSVLGSAIFSW